jgi:hypothetical protein
MVQAVAAPEVQDQPETGADVCGPERRDIGLDESHLDSGLPCPFARGAQGSRDDLDARDLPPPPRQRDRLHAGAATKVERQSKGLLAAALLAVEQSGDPVSSRMAAVSHGRKPIQ